ncbi:MAG TPA: sulfatase-like hydrolase/transferase [Acidobacteriota bacterium]|mgnify:CR=1 FL=1|nr:sulfatase-like hydrolase/transferase [Acidobacteriota bacterium]HRV07409.1 sulfatase-like hydrolase/transferase [Acidobacteriota bacterium]
MIPRRSPRCEAIRGAASAILAVVGRRIRSSVAACLPIVAFAANLEAGNFVLISVDTLRADRLSCYGYQANRTPHFDRLAEEGFRFANAYSEVPLTLPAHATLLTGILPLAHGIRDNGGFVLDQSYLTLAELFREAGYATGGFIGAYVLAGEFGVGQGFDTFDERFEGTIEGVTSSTQLQRPASAVTDALLAWLEGVKGQRFFAFVHYFDPHTPRPRGYDWEVSQVDDALGKVLRFLEGADLLDETTLILTSDHGESLGEHNESGHGFFVYDATLHIPLIIRPASSRVGPPAVVEDPVSLVDIAPTILDLAGIPVPETMQGRSLVPLLSGRPVEQRSLYAESYIPFLHFGWSPLRSIRVGNYKYIEAPRPELYDLAEDPGETRNIFRDSRVVAEQLDGRLRRFVERFERPSAPNSGNVPDPEVIDNLMSLGYVSGGSGRASLTRRIDPKDRIRAFEAYHELLNLLARHMSNVSVLQRIEDLRTSAPEILGIDFLLGWAFEQLGRTSDAVAAYWKAVTVDPENRLARVNLANLLIREGDYASAERLLLRVLQQAPNDYKARHALAGLYHLTKRDDLAKRELEALVAARPNYAAAWQNLGNLLLAEGHWTRAEEAFRRVTELQPGNAGAYFQLARILAAQGRDQEASAARERALQLDPRLRGLQ